MNEEVHQEVAAILLPIAGSALWTGNDKEEEGEEDHEEDGQSAVKVDEAVDGEAGASFLVEVMRPRGVGVVGEIKEDDGGAVVAAGDAATGDRITHGPIGRLMRGRATTASR